MLHTSRSLLLIATCVNVISRITIAADLTCKVPFDFTSDVSYYERPLISRGILNVLVRGNDLKVNSYSDTDSLEIRANRVILTLSGDLKSINENDGIANEPESIFVTFVDRITGIAHRASENSIDSATRDCRIALLPIETNSSSLDPRTTSKIRLLAESCMELKICSRIDRMEFENVEKSSSRPETSLLSINDRNLLIKKVLNEISIAPELQENINKLVDEGIAVFTDDLKQHGESKVPVPDFVEYFSTGTGIFRTDGVFHAKYGKFGDLTTIRRRSDAFLYRDGEKATASCAFGLDKAEFIYNYYTLKYGIIHPSGWMSGRMSSLIVEGQVTADYTQKPCVTTLDNLKVTRLGNIQIRISGLGILNWLLNIIANKIVAGSSHDIAQSIEDNVRDIATSRLSEFDCEQFRI